MSTHPSESTMVVPRRTFLAAAGMEFAGLAIGALLQEDGHATPRRVPNPPAKAKSVTWSFLAGCVSHMESFDSKPALNRYAGLTLYETPFQALRDEERCEKNLMGQGMSAPPCKPVMAVSTG